MCQHGLALVQRLGEGFCQHPRLLAPYRGRGVLGLRRSHGLECCVSYFALFDHIVPLLLRIDSTYRGRSQIPVRWVFAGTSGFNTTNDCRKLETCIYPSIMLRPLQSAENLLPVCNLAEELIFLQAADGMLHPCSLQGRVTQPYAITESTYPMLY